MRCRDVHRLANPVYLERFLFSGLPRVAPYCVPGGVSVVSGAGGCHLSDPSVTEIRKTVASGWFCKSHLVRKVLRAQGTGARNVRSVSELRELPDWGKNSA